MKTRYCTASSLDGELIVQLASVTLARGQPLLPRRITQPPLRLTSVRAIGSGFAALRYEVPKPGPR